MCATPRTEATPPAPSTQAPLTCKIQWVDKLGKLTPDTAPAVGYAYLVAHTEWFHGREIHIEESERFPICEYHAQRLNDLGMHHWRFIPLEQAQSA